MSIGQGAILALPYPLHLIYRSAREIYVYEYTVEGLKQSPSLNDIIFTPGLGVPLGIVLEETSNRLAKSDSQALRLISYVVNPTRAVIPDGRIAWRNFLGRTVAFQFSW